MNKLRTVVIEDDDSERHSLVKKLRQFTEIDLVGEAATFDESFQLIANTRPEAAFIDIKLIGGDVFALFKRLQDNGISVPYSVVTTGYPEYALSTLNDHRRFVVQYLLKPFLADWQSTFRKSIDALITAKLADSFNNTELNTPRITPYIFINDRGTLLRLDFDKIAYLEVAGGGETCIVTDTLTHQVDLTLTKFIEHLPTEQFQRISRHNIINSARILRVNRETRKVDIEKGSDHKSLAIGPEYYSDLIKNLPTAKEVSVRLLIKKTTPNPVVTDSSITTPTNGIQHENSPMATEKQKSKNLLRNILPKDLAEEYELTGQTKAQKFDLVTVMFCNIIDASHPSENILPEDLISDIDLCFRHFDEIIGKYHLEKIKTIGYTYICAGGLPKPDEDNPLRAVQAAIDMQQFLKEFKSTRQSQQLPWFEARIGIHSGPVIAGVVGQLKFTYDIWGDTVNTASQIEQMGHIGHVSLSEHTYQHVKRHFAYRCFGTVKTRNETELDVYLIEI